MEKKIQGTKPRFLPAKKLCTNQYYTIAVNDAGDIFSWGNNKDQRLGHPIDPNENEIIEYAKKYDFFANRNDKTIEVSCGSHHIAAVVSNKNETNEVGKVFTWGLALFGRLGYLDPGETENDLLMSEKLNYKINPHEVEIPEKVVRVTCGNDFTAALTVRGHVYTWGMNKNGYLGVDNITFSENNSIIPTPMMVKALGAKMIIQVACGSKHMMCLTSEKTVYSWGAGDYGILGHGSTSGINKPQIIKKIVNEEIIFIAAGPFCSAAINIQGHLFMWGRGKYGVLGFGSEDDQIIPEQVKDTIDDDKIFYVSLGFYHTLAISAESKSFAWGYSEGGRLGCMDKNDCDKKKRISTPREITSLRGMTMSQIFAGHYHSLAIEANTGKVWGWGGNMDNVLGKYEDVNVVKSTQIKDDQKTSRIIYKPIILKVSNNLMKITGGVADIYEAYFFSNKKVQNNFSGVEKGKIKTIACGGSHTIALTLGGLVFTWGFGDSGQLGVSGVNCCKDPTMVQFDDKKISKVYAGFANSMAISENFEIFLWGDGAYGQLGKDFILSDSKKYSDIPITIDELSGKDGKSGSLGFNNCAVIMSDGKLYVWGGNENRKLGIKSRNAYEAAPRLVECLNVVKKISCGMHHTAAINSNGELFTWGHGFFGQLGHGNNASSDEPKKVDKNDTKYVKVKCGSYHTLAIDKKGMVYICGKGGINLNANDDEHKTYPEVVDDFKSAVIKSIQAGDGTSFVLSTEKELYCWGDNSYNKISPTGEKKITKNAKQIKITFKEKVHIHKIFSGYNHAFLLNEIGHVYAWGCSECYRLTSKFDDTQPKVPQYIDILPNFQIREGNTIQADDGKRKIIDERQLVQRLKSKTNELTFKEVCVIIEGLEKKFGDDSLIQYDKALRRQMKESFESFAALTLNKLGPMKFVGIDKLISLRIRSIQPPLKKKKQKIPVEISANIRELENMMTLFYIHPCYFRDYFDDDKLGICISNFPTFFAGIRGLFTDLHKYYQRCMSYDNIIFLSIYKMLVDYEIRALARDPGKMYEDNNGYIEHIIKFYFFNQYEKNLLIELFEDSFKKIWENCRKIMKKQEEVALKTKEIEKYKSFIALIQNNSQPKEDIFALFDQMRALLSNLMLKAANIPHYVSFCMKILKKKLKKHEMTEVNLLNKKKIIWEIITRLFFRNILSALLKNLFSDNLNLKYLLKTLKVDLLGEDSDEMPSDAELQHRQYSFKLFTRYCRILAEFMEIIAIKKDLSTDFGEDISDKKSMAFLMKEKIEMFHEEFKKCAEQLFSGNKFDLKKEIISSLIYMNTETKLKKVRIELKDLVNFLLLIKSLFKCRQATRTLDIESYVLFQDSTQKKLKAFLNTATEVKVTLFLNPRFLLSPYEYVVNFKKELQLNISMQKNELTQLSRCKVCSLILPSGCILILDHKDVYLIKKFEDKIQPKFLLKISKVINDCSFSQEVTVNSISSLLSKVKEFDNKNMSKKEEDMMDKDKEIAIMEVASKEEGQVERRKERNENEYKVVEGALEELVNKVEKNNESKMFEKLVFDIFNHIKKQYQHYTFLTKISKVLFEIEDAKKDYILKIHDMNASMKVCINGLTTMENSLNVTNEKESQKLTGIDLAKSLTHLHLNLKKYSHETHKLSYRVIQEPIEFMLAKKILYDWSMKDKIEKGQKCILVIQAAMSKKKFDITIKTDRNVIMESSILTFEQYAWNMINSNCFSSFIINDIGVVNSHEFFKMINDNILENERRNEKLDYQDFVDDDDDENNMNNH